MAHIAIKLNPARLENPDLDIRYIIPDLVEQATAGRVRDDGYDYDDRDNSLVVFLSCANPDAELEVVIRVLRENEICGNSLLETATIGVSRDAKIFSIVHPTTEQGDFQVRDW